MAENRCRWAGTDERMVAYHDTEWGVPVHDDVRQFEFLVLESSQAGLSWQTILNKREGYRRAFAGFDVDKIARFNRRSVERLMNDASIVRNRAKIEAVITNARAAQRLIEEEGGLSDFLWRFVGGEPRVNRWREMSDLPAETEQSRALSKELKRRGFAFVGPTTMYAHLQAAGFVNDHVVSCFRWGEVGSSP